MDWEVRKVFPKEAIHELRSKGRTGISKWDRGRKNIPSIREDYEQRPCGLREKDKSEARKKARGAGTEKVEGTWGKMRTRSRQELNFVIWGLIRGLLFISGTLGKH